MTLGPKLGIILACGDFVLKELKVDIRGIKYTIKLVSANSFEAVYGKDIDAITTSSPYEMVFYPDALTLGIVMHEVAHAYLSASLLESTRDMSLYDLEENFCETFRMFGPEMIRKSKYIYNKLKDVK